MPVPAHERAARARAARGYAGLTQKDMASKLSVSVETLSRMENGRREITLEELQAIGQLCDVPQAFMQFGFEITEGDAPTGMRDMQHRLVALERQFEISQRSHTELDHLRGQLELIAEQLAGGQTGDGRTRALPPDMAEEVRQIMDTEVIPRLEQAFSRVGREAGRQDAPAHRAPRPSAARKASG